MERIRSFIAETRFRLNLRLLVAEWGPALLVCGLVATSIALWFVLDGRKVDAIWLLLAPCAGLAAHLFKVALQFHSRRSAAIVGDSVFGLKDSLITFLEFEEETEGNPFHLLRVDRTARLCGNLRPGSNGINVPWRLYLPAALCLLLTLWLCSFEDSPKVAADKLLAKNTIEKSSALRESLLAELERLQKDLDENGREALKRSNLEKMMKDFKETPDPREALRQYSKAETELAKLIDKDSVRNDDKLLSDAGERLKEDSSSKELGEKLASGNYKDAADKLSKMASEKPKGHDELKSKADKMERMAGKMEREASKREGVKSPLKDSMTKLSKSAERLQRDLKKALKDGSLEKLELSEKELDGSLVALEKELRGHNAKKAFLTKMKPLGDYLREAERIISSEESMESLCRQCSSGIGTAAAGNFDNTKASPPKSSYDSALKGTKSKGGETFTKVEEASSGTGVATATGKRTDADFKRQYESFIRREDVPEGMKGAVKLYFNSLHNRQE